MPESIGSLYPTQVPSYTEAADIRKAFNLYHYGTETVPTSEDDILPSSIAGYIRDVLAAVESAEIGETVILSLSSTDNLNFSDVVQSGTYKSAIGLSNEEAVSLNYPVNSLGLLTFVKTTDSTYFQTYISVSDNGYWWRVGVRPQVDVVWGQWQKAAETNHTHDTRYYTQSQINSRLNMTTAGLSGAPAANTVAIFDGTSRVTSSTINTLDLGKLSGLNSSGVLGASTLSTYLSAQAAKLPNNQKIFIQSAQPSNPAIGDIWLW